MINWINQTDFLRNLNQDMGVGGIACEQWEMAKRSKWIEQSQVRRSISMRKEESVGTRTEKRPEEGG